MTKIALYPLDTNIQEDDILIGTDEDTPGRVTKNFSVGDLKAYVFNSLIFQSLTPIPLSNTSLNLTYPNAVIGTQVICPVLSGVLYVDKVYVYTCVDSELWALDIRDKVI
jgi:hypothetical protein